MLQGQVCKDQLHGYDWFQCSCFSSLLHVLTSRELHLRGGPSVRIHLKLPNTMQHTHTRTISLDYGRAAHYSMLCLFARPKVGRIRFKKVIRLRGMSPRHIMEGRRGDIVRLALAD